MQSLKILAVPASELLEIVGPALVVALMISLTHAPLGLEVLKRGIIFIDLAVAQISGLCLIFASLVFHEKASSSWYLAQGIALSGAMLAALGFHLLEQKTQARQEAMIGSSFVLAGSLSLLLLSDQTHRGEQIQELLSGQILFVTWENILFHAPIYLFVLGLWFLRPACRRGIAFYLLFSLAITSSVQLVGVYVVFASLIFSALAAIDAKRKYLTAWSCGMLSVILAILTATALDWPAGPVVVISYALICVLTLALRHLLCSLVLN